LAIRASAASVARLGRSQAPQWQPWTHPSPAASAEDPAEKAHWLLSLYLPAGDDQVDWKRGSYSTLERRAHREQLALGELKRRL